MDSQSRELGSKNTVASGVEFRYIKPSAALGSYVRDTKSVSLATSSIGSHEQFVYTSFAAVKSEYVRVDELCFLYVFHSVESVIS